MPDHKDKALNVDEVYGLEPVIEPGEGETAGDSSASVQWRAVQCPYCGESFETAVDLSSGSTSYIEDCQVCCQPIEFTLDVADDGTLARLQLGRGE